MMNLVILDRTDLADESRQNIGRLAARRPDELKCSMGPTEQRIFEKIKAAFSPEHFELVNESHSHSVPKNSETHFKLVLVSKAFEGLSRVARQRKVYDVLKDELAPGGVHALAQRALTPAEWAVDESNFDSPNCLGGSKRENI